MLKDPCLLTFSFVTYMERKDHCSQDGKYFDLIKTMDEKMVEVASEYGVEVECCPNGIYVLGGRAEPDNSGRCEICNAWTSAQNQKNIIGELEVGAMYEGKLYCWTCLPKKSPIYHKLFPVWDRDDEVDE